MGYEVIAGLRGSGVTSPPGSVPAGAEGGPHLGCERGCGPLKGRGPKKVTMTA